MFDSEAEVRTEQFILGIHRATQNSGIECPEPDLHVYLSGILQRNIDHKYQFFAESFKTETPMEYIRKIDRFGVLSLPNPLRYFFARVNAEDITLDQALETIADEDKIKFAAHLYEVAAFYRKRYARNTSETDILIKMSKNLPICVEVLSCFYKNYKGEIPEFDEYEIKYFSDHILQLDKERGEMEEFKRLMSGIELV